MSANTAQAKIAAQTEIGGLTSSIGRSAGGERRPVLMGAKACGLLISAIAIGRA